MFDGKIPTQPGTEQYPENVVNENEAKTSAIISCLKALLASSIVILLGYLYYKQKNPCPMPLLTAEQCATECNTECIDVEYKGVQCKQCGENTVSTDAITCPNNTTSNIELCKNECTNGICMVETTVQDTACYTCLTCKNGDFSNEEVCENSCEYGCMLMGKQDALSCWGCKKDCSTVCKERGYDPPGTKYYDYLRSEINQYSCVSGFGVQEQGFLIEECECAIKPKIIVDDTKPVCPESPCGPIACNEVKTCTLDSGQQAQVTCQWQGWEEISPGVFVPKIGG